MRKLTIRRRSTFVASLAKIHYYISDDISGDTVINGAKCRRIGSLSNGEINTFEIPNESSRIYAIADKLSKGYCNEFIDIPEGEGDVFLSGKNEFNPFSGNAFRFDNNFNPEVLANRQKSRNKGIIVIICAVIAGLLIGGLVIAPALLRACDLSAPKTFSENGMSITLDRSFWESSLLEKYDFAAMSTDVLVIGIKNEFIDYPDIKDYSTEKFVEALIQASDHKDAKLKLNTNSESYIYYYEYDEPVDGEMYHYVQTIHKTDEAFWVVVFAVEKDDYSEHQDDIFIWMDKITFK